MRYLAEFLQTVRSGTGVVLQAMAAMSRFILKSVLAGRRPDQDDAFFCGPTFTPIWAPDLALKPALIPLRSGSVTPLATRSGTRGLTPGFPLHRPSPAPRVSALTTPRDIGGFR